MSSSSSSSSSSRAYARVATLSSQLQGSVCAATSSSDRVVIVSAARTPLGSFNGALSSFSAPELAGFAMKHCLDRLNLTNASQYVEEVILGHVLGADVGQAPATQAAIKAGLPVTTPCTTVNKVCASGMKALQLGALSIQSGQRSCVLVGGMESMSQAPFYLSDMRSGKRFRLGEEKIKDAVISDGLTDKYFDVHMGTAAELCASKFNITRQDQDNFAKLSYQRAQQATKAGHFRAEIVPITIKQKNKDKKDIILQEDEEVFRVNFDRLSSLRTAFPTQLKKNPQPKELLPADYKEDKNAKGTVTAANASVLSDGASALLLMSESLALSLKLQPLGVVLSQADAALSPLDFCIAPAKAIPEALKRANLSINDVDAFEINEAFSVVSLANQQLLKLDSNKLNKWGGAVSLGHPIGNSGARIIVTLLSILQQEQKNIGVASICNGGGGASAVVIQRWTPKA